MCKCEKSNFIELGRGASRIDRSSAERMHDKIRLQRSRTCGPRPRRRAGRRTGTGPFNYGGVATVNRAKWDFDRMGI